MQIIHKLPSTKHNRKSTINSRIAIAIAYLPFYFEIYITTIKERNSRLIARREVLLVFEL
jgi:hypothetical protein